MLKQAGVTLIELVIVIVILGLISVAGGTLLTEFLSNYSDAQALFNADWQGQLGIRRMSQDIALIRSSADISSATSSTLSFTDINNNTISYTLSGTSLTLTKNGNASVLADGIQSLAFSYFDENGSTTATASLIREIQYTINITQQGVNYSLTSMAYPRNVT